MANRHAHKKLRAEIRARMAETGESYQKARTCILAQKSGASDPKADLVHCSYFGFPLALATIEARGTAIAILVPSSRMWGRGYPQPYPPSLLRAAMRARGGVQ
jgi:hypothetical protein